MARRIGIFGGSFNPIHLGHLIMAQDAMESCELDTVLFVPSGRPPHKAPSALVPGPHRLAMLELALEDNPWFDLCTVELDRPGVSYSLDTVRAVRRRYPGDAIHFIIGSDSLPELPTWYRAAELLQACTVVTVERPGYPLPSRRPPPRWELPEPALRALLEHVVQGHRLGISSSDIRMRVAEGMSIRYLVPAAVEMYIMEHGLYRD